MYVHTDALLHLCESRYGHTYIACWFFFYVLQCTYVRAYICAYTHTMDCVMHHSPGKFCTIPLACVQTFTLHYTTGVCANIRFALYHWRVCKHSLCTIPLACMQTFPLHYTTGVYANIHFDCTDSCMHQYTLHTLTCFHWICYLYKQMHLHVALSFDLYLQYGYVRMYV